MTKKKCLFLVLTMLVFGFFGCQKIEQTEANIGDSRYFTTVQGTLLYPAGVTATDLGGTPAAGKKVFIDVPKSYYFPSSTGVERFEATTDNQGKFTFKIPAKIASVSATIKVEPFSGKHYIFEQYVQEGNNYVPKFVQKDVIYKFGGVPVTITASGLENKNLILAYDLAGVEQEFQFSANYKFYVERISYAEPQGPPYFVTPEWKSEPNKDVIVTVIRSSNTYVYLGKSNSNGLVSVDIPIKEIEENLAVSVTANPFRGNLTYYEVSNDHLTYASVNKSGVFSTDGFYTYCTLKALQAVTDSKKVSFTFTPDQK